MRGRPNRNAARRADRNPAEGTRSTELSLRIGADFPLNLVGNTVWRIERRPVWNTLAADAAFWLLTA